MSDKMFCLADRIYSEFTSKFCKAPNRVSNMDIEPKKGQLPIAQCKISSLYDCYKAVCENKDNSSVSLRNVESKLRGSSVIKY